MQIYLSGEIHTNWRDEIMELCQGLDVTFTSPVLDHAASDDCGVTILGAEDNKFWHDNKGAKVNAIRTRKAISDADVVVVRFGEKYKQWNAAFDAGYAAALNKSIIIIHNEEHQHALNPASINRAVQRAQPSSPVGATRVSSFPEASPQHREEA